LTNVCKVSYYTRYTMHIIMLSYNLQLTHKLYITTSISEATKQFRIYSDASGCLYLTMSFLNVTCKRV